MGINLVLITALCAALLVIGLLLRRLKGVREQLSVIEEALEDISSGNLNRRVLTKQGDMTQKICFSINNIATESQARLIRQKQSEQAYKGLMTGISHDVKTPLASLVGYLEAMESGIVTGEEKEEYLHVAHDKAQNLKRLVENLFAWVKLDAGEQIFRFETLDLNELSRNIVGDWVPALESSGFSYRLTIPEGEYFLGIDADAYSRILGNLIENALTHSQGNELCVRISENDRQAEIQVSDNGKGIAAQDLPHIFERLYQCDKSRSAKGNGLGLSIVKELVTAHKGIISADSGPRRGTIFTILLPKAL